MKTPVRTPQANAYCERVIGTMRRECLDFIIPLNERHLRRTVREWRQRYLSCLSHAISIDARLGAAYKRVHLPELNRPAPYAALPAGEGSMSA